MTRLLFAVAVLLGHAALSLADDGGLSSTKLGKLGLGDLQVKEGATPAGPEDDAKPAAAVAAVVETSAKATPTPATTLRRVIEPVLSRPAKPQAVVESLPALSIKRDTSADEYVTVEKIDADRLIDVNAEVARRRRELQQAQAAARQAATIARRAAARVVLAQTALEKARAELAAAQ